MKKHLTKLVFTFLTIALLGQAGISQTYIWGGPGDANSEFNGGLNDWTVNATPDSALWVWEADGQADRGAYFGTRGPIQSPSVSNGAAVFDSDFYDNAGTSGNFGNGIAPAPQVGELISPEFSCEGHTSVWIQFNEYYRNYQSTTTYAVSIDGGETWIDGHPINTDVAVNAQIDPATVKLIDISDIAANQANVKIKFIFNANYYFWVIDDVYIIDSPPADPQIGNTWYPPNRFNTPQSQITNDSMYFIMQVINRGGVDMLDNGARVTIINENEETLFIDSLNFDVAVGDTVDLEFNSFMPESDIDTGLYAAVYEIFTENSATNLNKKIVHYFYISPSFFDSWDGENNIYNSTYTFTDGHISGATNYQGAASEPSSKVYNLNYYKMADWAENDNIEFRTTEALLKASLATRPDIVPTLPVSIFFFEIADTIDNYLNNFRGDDGIIVDGKESDQLTYLGYASENYNNYEALSLLHVPFADAEDENDYILLKPNKKYLIACYWSDEGDYYIQAYDNHFNGTERYSYNGQFLSFIYTDFGGEGHYAAVGVKYKWVLGMNLKMFVNTVSTDDELFQESTIQIKENPVRNNLYVDIHLNETVDKATMVIHNINGGIIDMRTVKNIKEGSYKFYTGNLPAGTYIFTMFTKDKLLSKKFVVAK